MRRAEPALYLEVCLVALAVILVEVGYTRVFSFKLVYYFTYLIIGIALLGLGTGGVLAAMVPRLRRAPVDRVVPLCCLAGAVAVLGGYVVVARVQLNTFDLADALGRGQLARAFPDMAKLIGICLALFAPFLAGGLALAVAFSTRSAHIARLYFVDLLGAAAGCAIAVPLMTTISPPGTVMTAGVAFALAGLPLAARRSSRFALGLGVLAAILVAGAVASERLPQVVPDRVKTMSPQNHPMPIFTRWHPVFRVDVLANDAERRGTYILAHDGMWGSILPKYDGDAADLTRYDRNERGVPFALLGEGARVAIIGAAGGNEILASLHFRASHVTAVELNPVTVSLLTETFADYVGHVASDPRVTLVNAEGRSFLQRDDTGYDLIWFVAPDSYAAMNAATAGAYVLSESYLYTVEMIEESLRSLAPGGVVCTQFGQTDFETKPNRTLRYLTSAREALARLGVEDHRAHMMVATASGFLFSTSTILLKREPFTPEEVASFLAKTAQLEDGRVRYAPGVDVPDGLVRQAIVLPPAALDDWYAAYPFDVRPVTDDAPFFWHFVPFSSALRPPPGTRHMAMEDGMGERLLVVFLGVAVLFGATCLLLPLIGRRRVWREIPHKGRAAVYFASLGVGFMFIEVSLMQRLTLFLGYPTYALTVTLFSLLVFTGLGSLLSDRLAADRDRALVRLGLVLLALVVLYHFGLAPLASVGIGWPFGVRVAVAVLALAPLGLCLGTFMPLGVRTVASLGPHGEEYVAWAWAVNGFFSVASSVMATILSMTIGFDAVMLVSLAIYGAGIAALHGLPEPARAPAAVPLSPVVPPA